MKKLLTCIATGLLLVGLTGVTQAAGYYNASEDCCTEGPAYKRSMRGPAVPTIVVLDEGPLYIEGMGFEPRPQGPKTVVPKVAKERDWCCEDMTEAQEEMHFRKANQMEPAAGY